MSLEILIRRHRHQDLVLLVCFSSIFYHFLDDREFLLSLTDTSNLFLTVDFFMYLFHFL